MAKHKHGGKRPNAGLKIEPGREKSIQIHPSVQPITDRKIQMLADKRGCSTGRVIDDLVEVLINFEVQI